jgi:hypothetical protein
MFSMSKHLFLPVLALSKVIAAQAMTGSEFPLRVKRTEAQRQVDSDHCIDFLRGLNRLLKPYGGSGFRW